MGTTHSQPRRDQDERSQRRNCDRDRDRDRGRDTSPSRISQQAQAHTRPQPSSPQPQHAPSAAAPRRMQLRRRISSLLRREPSTAKRERSASSSVHHPSPGRPVPKRRRVLPDDTSDVEELDMDHADVNSLHLSGAGTPGPSSLPSSSSHSRSQSRTRASPTLHPLRSPASPASGSATPAEAVPSPTDELLAERLRTISTIRDALGPDWTPASSTSSLAPVDRLFARFRRPSMRRREESASVPEVLRPPTPSLSSGNSSAATSTTSSAPRSLSHRLSAIMGFAARGEEWEEAQSHPPPFGAAPLPAATAAAVSEPEPDSSAHDDPARIPVGAVLVIQGLAQTHANVDEVESRSGDASPRTRIDVASLDQQARMIGNLLTVAAAATATTLLSPTSLAPAQNRTTAHSAMQTIIERFRPQRSRPSQSIESTLGEYLRTVLRDNRRFAEAVAGDATSGNIPSEFQDFLQTLQQDLILAVRAYAVPEEEAEGAEGSENAGEENGGANANADAGNAEPAMETSGPTPAPAEAAEAIPTFHHQRGQNLPGTNASRLGVSGGVDGVPRRLNFFRAHLFPSVSNGGDDATDDDANAVVPSIFVGVRSVTHDPNMTTEDLVGHPGFPFLDGQVPDSPGGIPDDEHNFDRDLERELSTPAPTTTPLPGPSLSPPLTSSTSSNASRRTLRDRVRDRFTPRREARLHAPLNTYLIYVIGGNYPRSHPVLAIPSLVSGGPLTAEDLALVSELLGPAKPPTASAEEISRSGLAVVPGKDMADLVAKGSVLEASNERCMVCLGDYELEDECRILKCRHAFHKECVDHWLSQGRNSCPACRTEAVDKDKVIDDSVATAAPAAA